MSKNKKNKNLSMFTVIALVAAILLGGIITFLIVQNFIKVPVVVAARNITAYSEPLVAEDFRVIEVAKGDRENFAAFISNPSELLGKVAISDVYEGQPVKRVQFVNPEDAESVQNVVSNPEHRGIYLPIGFEGGLCGDMKTGGVYDLFLIVSKPSPTAGNPDNVEPYVLQLQKSYKINKYIPKDSGGGYVFMEFPKEESEEYLLVKNMIDNDKAYMVATMPNAVSEPYDGENKALSTVFGAMIKKPGFFTSISQLEEDGEDVDVTVKNDANDDVTSENN